MFGWSKAKTIRSLEGLLREQMERNKELADQIRLLTDRLVLLTDSKTYFTTNGVGDSSEYDPALYYGGGQDQYETLDDLGQKIVVDRPMFPATQHSHIENSGAFEKPAKNI